MNTQRAFLDNPPHSSALGKKGRAEPCRAEQPVAVKYIHSPILPSIPAGTFAPARA
jgi:hypothetical protein